MKKQTQAEIFGKTMADAIIKAANLTFSAWRGKSMVNHTIKELQRRVNEIQPKKAEPSYKEARYGKK